MRRKLDAQTWLLLGAGVLAIVIVSIDVVPDFIVYNASTSIPPGFYVRDNGPPRRGAIVTVRAIDVAPPMRGCVTSRTLTIAFINHVAAVDGDTVCTDGATVTINDERVAVRAVHDRRGRLLPTWSGSRTLHGEVLLLGDTVDSFDGRYWGPTPVNRVEGVWRRVGDR